jgi:hypothetical protein
VGHIGKVVTRKYQYGTQFVAFNCGPHWGVGMSVSPMCATLEILVWTTLGFFLKLPMWTPYVAHQTPHWEKLVHSVIGIATFVELLCEYFNITEGAVKVACDGLSALNDVFDLQQHVSTKTQHYNLVVVTRRIIQ